MATAKTVTTLGDKMIKVNDNFTVNMYDNGYMIEVGGRTKKGEYTTAKILCSNVEQLVALVQEACTMDRDS
jgi:hypothetical protein